MHLLDQSKEFFVTFFFFCTATHPFIVSQKLAGFSRHEITAWFCVAFEI
jgi:hypothetical protein